MNTKEFCIADSATTHRILRDQKYFSQLTFTNENVSTIFDTSNIIEGSERATIILSGGTNLEIRKALHSAQSRRALRISIRIGIILR